MARGGGWWLSAGARKGKEGGFYRPSSVLRRFRPTFVVHRSHDMDAEAVATCDGTPANGGVCVRAPVSAGRPRGTSLASWHASPPLGTHCPWSPASDRWVFGRLGVRAHVRRWGPTRRVAVRRHAGARVPAQNISR
jgi:hypothetical protein